MSQASTTPIPFPRAPSAARSIAGAVPVPVTSLLGRDGDVAQILALIDRDDVRVVTLLGPGGVGKTRLALEVANRIGPDFADGAAFVPLEAIRDAALVSGAVALALGIPEQPGRDIADQLIDVLAGQHLLLVLDNCEQVVGAAPFVARLLMRCPRLRLVATSRRSLNIAGEQQMRIAPLSVPEPGQERTAAVDLFIERALAANLDLPRDGPALQAIGEICRRLDGLPLAIELAAARVTVLSPQALLARLTHRLKVLTGGRSDAPARLRSMADAIGWSYDLLTPDAQQLFRRASVFLGSFSLEAAAYILGWPGPPEEDHAFGLVEALVDQNLVQAVPDAPEPRFRMLETIREYGQRELASRSEGDDAMRAHVEYVLDLARRAEWPLIGPDQGHWMDRLEAEYPNVLAAVDWLADHQRLDDAVTIPSAIRWFLFIRGRFLDVIARLEGWRDRPDLGPRAHGQVLLTLGMLKSTAGSFRDAAAMLQEAVAIFREAGDSWHEAVAHATLTVTYTMGMDLEGFRETAPLSLRMARAAGYHRGVCMSLVALGLLAGDAGDLDRSRSWRDEVYRTAAQHGDVWIQAGHLRGRAWFAASAWQLDEAEALAVEAMNLAESLGARRDIVLCWHQLANIAHARGDHQVAAQRIGTAIAMAKASGFSWFATTMLITSAMIDVARDELESARESLVTALRSYEESTAQGVGADFAECLEVYALLAARVGDIPQTIRFHAASKRFHLDAGLGVPKDVESIWLQRELQAALGDQGWAQAESASESVDKHEIAAEALAFALPIDTVARPVPTSQTLGLSPRELEVLKLVAGGMSNQQIADVLYVSLRTVTAHVSHILAKLDVNSRTGAASLAIRAGLA